MAPRTIVEAFGEFDAALNLDRRELEQAQRRHQEVTEVLTAARLPAARRQDRSRGGMAG